MFIDYLKIVRCDCTIQNIGYLTSNRTIKGNEIFTPFYAVEPLLKYLPIDKKIWCPFDEEWSAFYQSLKENGFDVIRSSLAEGQDFFAYEPGDWDLIVSNPPFSLKTEVLKRLYELDKPFAILLPINSLQGKNRYKYFRNGIQLLAFSDRIAYHTNFNFEMYTKGTAFASAYFCKGILPKDLIIEELIENKRPLKIIE